VELRDPSVDRFPSDVVSVTEKGLELLVEGNLALFAFDDLARQARATRGPGSGMSKKGRNWGVATTLYVRRTVAKIDR
jgi:hypothetical protein